MLSLLRRLFRKSARPRPPASASSLLDAFRRPSVPTPYELLAQLKNTAWTCASINAAICASHPPRLFVATNPGHAPTRLPTRSLSPNERLLLSPKLKSANRPMAVVNSTDPHSAFSNLQSAIPPEPPLNQKAARIEEVTSHPLLTLLEQVNPAHNQHDLLELTQLYLEVHGAAFWLLDFDPVLALPVRIWPLPSHLVSPRREPGSPRLVDYYEYRGETTERFPPERIIHFRFPDPRDPFTAGLSPLRACFEQAALASEYAALKRSLYENAGLPSAIITPGEGGVGTDEHKRVESEWRQKFQHGGRGQVLITDSTFKVTLLSQSLGDLAALADLKATKEDIANAFHVPLPFLSGDTNLANMQAADHLHKTLAILPRLRRRDEKLNEQLIPLFDPTGRLFFATDDPTPQNQDFVLKQEASDVRLGVRTINEVRATRGLPPVSWANEPPSRAA